MFNEPFFFSIKYTKHIFYIIRVIFIKYFTILRIGTIRALVIDWKILFYVME